MEDKILALYAQRQSQRDIAEQIKELYGVGDLRELVADRRKDHAGGHSPAEFVPNHKLEPVYPFVFMDAIHYKRGPAVCDEGSLCGAGCLRMAVRIFWAMDHNKQQILAERA